MIEKLFNQYRYLTLTVICILAVGIGVYLKNSHDKGLKDYEASVNANTEQAREDESMRLQVLSDSFMVARMDFVTDSINRSFK